MQVKSESLKLTESGISIMNALYNFNKQIKTKKMKVVKETPKEKIYLGNGSGVFDNNIINLSLDITKLKEILTDHSFMYNDKQYIKIKVCKKKEVDQYGRSHYIELDTFKPEVHKSVEKE